MILTYCNHHVPLYLSNIFAIADLLESLKKKEALVDTGRHQGFSSTINAQSELKLQVLGVVPQQLPRLKVAQTFKSTLAVTLSALEASFIAKHL